MSYILDALRKADAERERDPARGIHAQPLAGTPAQARAGGPRKAAMLAAGVVIAAIAVYALWPRDASLPRPTPGAAVSTPAPLAAPAVVVVPPRVPAVVQVATSVQPGPPPMPVAAPPPLVIKAPAATIAAKAVAAAAPAAPGMAPAAPAPSAPAAEAAPARIYALAELPGDVQQQLPKLAITGGVHSENVAQRMLIVGGQVLNEGSEVAPGVVLEQIRARTAVLRFRGYRYAVAY